MGIGKKLTGRLKRIYANTKVTVKTDEGMTESTSKEVI